MCLTLTSVPIGQDSLLILNRPVDRGLASGVHDCGTTPCTADLGAMSVYADRTMGRRLVPDTAEQQLPRWCVYLPGTSIDCAREHQL